MTVTRLASGLPVGADLEYADEITLGKALAGRRAALASRSDPATCFAVSDRSSAWSIRSREISPDCTAFSTAFIRRLLVAARAGDPDHVDAAP